MEYIIDKPISVGRYDSHRMVAGLTGGKSATWFDRGDQLIIRTLDAVPLDGAPINSFLSGQIIGFQLKAACGTKVKGKHRYFPLHDWRSRHEWLKRKGEAHGFEILTVHAQANRENITAGVGPAVRRFSIDATLFTGVLKVTDPARFAVAVINGVGSTGRAFGFGLLQF